MRKVLSVLAVWIAAWTVAATTASALVVRFDAEEISPISAAGFVVVDVASFSVSLTFDFVDTDQDGTFDTGTLIATDLMATGPIVDADTGGNGFVLTLLPGQVDLTQIPDGTEFLFPDPLDMRAEPGLLMATAADPAGSFSGNLFTFLAGAELSLEGAPDTGVASCDGPACLALPGIPIELSGPQAPIPLDDAMEISFVIDGLETIDTMPASLTGDFGFRLGTIPLAFQILSSSGTVVPEPDASLGLLASIGALTLLRRFRRA